MPSYQSTGTINNDVWTHVAITIDKENNVVRFYKDNTLINVADAQGLNIVNNANTLLIGTNSGEYFKGSLDDVRVYDRVISANELSGIYQDKFAKNLILHYDFELYDHANAVVYDESAYNNHGVLVNKETEQSDFTKDIGEYAVSGTAFKAEVDQHIRIPVTATNNIQGSTLENCTFTAWVKTSQLNSYEPILHKDGVFSFGLDYGHAHLKFGDGTKMYDLPAISLMDMSGMGSSTGEVVLKDHEIYTKKIYKGAYNGTDFTEITVPGMSETDYIYARFNGGETRMFILMPDKKTLYCYTETATASYLTASGSTSAGSTTEFIPCDVYNTFLAENNLTVKHICGTSESSIIHTSDNKFYYIGKSADVGYGTTTNVTTPTEITYLSNFLEQNPTIAVIKMKEIHMYATCILFKDLITGKQLMKASGQVPKTYPVVTADYDWTIVNEKINWNDSTQTADYEIVEFATGDHYTWNLHLKNNLNGEAELYTLSNRASQTALTRLTNCENYFNALPDSTWKLSPVAFFNGNYLFVFIEVTNTVYGTKELYQYQYNNTTATRLSLNDDAILENNKQNVVFGSWIHDTTSMMYCIRDPSLATASAAATTTSVSNVNIENKRIAEVNFNQPNELAHPNTLFEHTEGRYEGSMAMRINETQHLELDGASFSNANMNTMSFSAWIKPDSVIGEQPILARYGDENIVKFSMSNSELTLDIVNQSGPNIGDVTVTKTYNPMSDGFDLVVEGHVADRASGYVYVLATKDSYLNVEKVIADYAVANLTPVTPFFGKLDRMYFKSPAISTYLDSHTSAVTKEIKTHSDFYVMIVGVDDNGFVSVYRMNNKDIQSSEGYDATLALTNLRGGYVGNEVSVNFDVTSANEVEISASVFSFDIGTAVDLDKVTTFGGSADKTTFSYATKVAKLDAQTSYSVNNITRAYVFVDVYNPVSHQRLQTSLMVENTSVADVEQPLANILQVSPTANGASVDFSVYSAVSPIEDYCTAVFMSDMSGIDKSDIYAKIVAVKADATAVYSKPSANETLYPQRVYTYNAQLTKGIASDGSLVTLDPSASGSWDARVVAFDALGNMYVSEKKAGAAYDTGDKLFNSVHGVGLNTNKQLGDGTNTNQTSGSVQTFMNLSVRKIATGHEHTMVITTDNKLYGVGRNNYGQIGDGTTTIVSEPKQVLPFLDIQDVACGYEHTAVLTTDGKVFVMGRYNHGQLGIGVTTDTGLKDPVQILPEHNILKIACSGYTSYFVTDDFRVFACGLNSVGQIGDGTTTNRSSPVEIDLGDDAMVVDVFATSSSGTTVYLLLLDGRLMATGYNEHGQLGDGTTTNVSTPKQVPIPNPVKKLSCGNLHTIVMDVNNHVYAFGYNSDYQLATGDNTNKNVPTRIVQDLDVVWIVTGYGNTMFGTKDKKLYAIGYNSQNQLGTGDRINLTTLTEVTVDGLPSEVVYVYQNVQNSTAFFMTGLSSEMVLENVAMAVNPMKASASITSGATEVEYAIFAMTSDPSGITNAQIETIMTNNPEAFVKGTVPAFDRKILADVEIPKVIDASGNAVDSSAVNAGGVVIRLKNAYNGTLIETAYTSATSPALKVSKIYYDFINKSYKVSGSVFSSTHGINSFFVTGFDFSTLAHTDEALRDFALGNTSSPAMVQVTQSVAQNTVGTFEVSTNNLFADIANASSLTTDVEATTNTDFRVLMNVAGGATEDVIGSNLPPGPYQVWVYMLEPSKREANNFLVGILMYDTPNAWSDPTTENGNRLSYELETDNSGNSENQFMVSPEFGLTETGIESTVNGRIMGRLDFADSLASDTNPILKLGNIDSSVRSVYPVFSGTNYAFAFKLELRDSSENVITQFSDLTASDMTGSYQRTNLSTLYNASVEWNIPSLGDRYTPSLNIPVNSDMYPKIQSAVYDTDKYVVKTTVFSSLYNVSNIYVCGFRDLVIGSSDVISMKNFSPADLSNATYQLSESNTESFKFDFISSATNIVFPDFSIGNNESIDFDMLLTDHAFQMRFGLTTANEGTTNNGALSGTSKSVDFRVQRVNGGIGVFGNVYESSLTDEFKEYYCRLTRNDTSITYEAFQDKERTTLRSWKTTSLTTSQDHSFGSSKANFFINVTQINGVVDNLSGESMTISNLTRKGGDTNRDAVKQFIVDNAGTATDLIKSQAVSVNRSEVGYFDFELSQVVTTSLDVASTYTTAPDDTTTYFYMVAKNEAGDVINLSEGALLSETSGEAGASAAEPFVATSVYRDLYSVGLNTSYQLGKFFNNSTMYTPEKVLSNYSVSSLACSTSTVVFSTKDGVAYGFGVNANSQLGTGDTTNYNNIPVRMMDNVTQVAIGEKHTVLLTATGEVFASGDNADFGQLGVGNNTNQNTFQKVYIEGVKQIACGDLHTVFLKSDGTAFACGYNGNGQLGNGNTTNSNTPVQITVPAGQTVVKVFAGMRNTYFITTAGEVYATGRNDEGQLGVDNTTQQTTPVKVVEIPAGDAVVDVALGEAHALFMTEGKKAYATGRNTNGQLATGDTTASNKPVQVMADYDVSDIGCSINESYFNTPLGLYSVGKNTYGQLGDDSNTARTAPVQVQLYTTDAIGDIVSSPTSQFVYFMTMNESFSVSMDGRFESGLEIDLDIQASDKAISWYSIVTTSATSVTLATAKALVTDEANKALVLSGVISPYGQEYRKGYSVPKVYVESGVTTESYKINSAKIVLFYKDSSDQEFFEVKQVGLSGPHAVLSDVSVSASGVSVKGSVFSASGISEFMVAGFKSKLTDANLNLAKQMLFNLRSTADTQVIYREVLNNVNRGKVTEFETTSPLLYVFDTTFDGKTVAVTEADFAEYDIRVLMLDRSGVNGFNDSSITLPSLSFYEAVGIGKNTNNMLLLYNGNATVSELTKSGDIKDMSMGYQYSIFKDSKGDVYTIGVNGNGQLGNGTTTTSTEPVLVELPDEGEKPDKFATGYFSTFVISQNGRLYSVGHNTKGQLGIMTILSTTSFSEVVGDLRVKSVKAGHYHSAIITEDDTVMTSGLNNYGQLGHGNLVDTNVYVPMKLEAKAKQLECGPNVTAIVTYDNEVYIAGQNNVGQLGIGNTTNQSTPVKVNLTNVAKVSCGYEHTVFLTKEGNVYTCGGNSKGQLGDSTKTAKNTLTRVMANHKIVDIFTGTYSTFFVTSDGSVYSTGYNNSSQLGVGHTTDVSVPEIVINGYDITKIVTSIFNTSNTMFLRSSLQQTKVQLPKRFDDHPFIGSGFGDVFVSGQNNYGELGNNNTSTNQKIPIKVMEDLTIKKACMANNCSIFLTVDGEAYAVGYGGNNRLGTGSTTNQNTPVQVLSSEVIADVDVSPSHTAFVTEDGKVFMCGANTSYQLGTGNTTASSTPLRIMNNYKMRQVSCGKKFTLFLTTDGVVYGVGDNTYGSLGDGSSGSNTTRPKLVSTPAGKKIIEIATTGYFSSYFVTEDNELYSCGQNSKGECGVNSITMVKTPELVQGLEGVKVIGVRCGLYHVSVLTDKGVVYVCGDNTYGQLGRPTTTATIKTFEILDTYNKSVVSIECAQNSSYFVTEDNEAYACGHNAYGELGDHSTFNRVEPHLVRCEGNPVVSVQGGNSAQGILFGTLKSGLKASIGDEVAFEYLVDSKELKVTTTLSSSSEEGYEYYLVAVTDPDITLEAVKTMTLLDRVAKGTLAAGVSNKQVVSTLTEVDTTGVNYTLEGVNTARVFIYLTNQDNSVEHLKEVVWHRAPESDAFVIKIDGVTYPVTLDRETDASPDKTPWVLALNYIHQGGTNPELNVRDTTKGFPVLPEDGSLDFESVDINGTVPDGSVDNPDAWGHTGLDLFDKLCIALGSGGDNANGLEVRFVGKIQNTVHSRIINFKTEWVEMLKEFRYGTGNTSSSWPSETYTLLDDHTAELPGVATSFFNSSTADDGMTHLVYFKPNGPQWSPGEGRWGVDNYATSTNQANNTYHQIWVRANK